jgi:signal transduction histidine kinase
VTRRLLLSYLIVAAIVLLVLEVPLAIFYQQRETQRLSAGAERDAAQLASLYEEALERQTALRPATAARYAARTGARVVVADAAGRSLIDTAGAVHRDFSTRPEVKVALSGHIATGTRHSATLRTDLLYVAVPVASGGRVLGVVRLTTDTHVVAALVHRFWLGLAAIAAVVLAAVAAIGWAIARSVNRPLHALHLTADRFATGDLATAAADPDAPPEIAALGETMNTMARRLDTLLREHRAFVADASHQLRTPLTALRLRLENVQSDIEALSRDAPGARAAEPGAAAAPGGAAIEELDAAIGETDRLSGLVNDLLRLARAERPAAAQTADLAELARDRADTWSAVAEAAGVSLRFAAPGGPLVVRAVPTGIEQIADNLIDNAVAASPPGSHVVVSVARGAGVRSLTVADEGPGLDDDAKARALERFWRQDHSTPGSGLGLPIARALAEASGGSLALHDAEGGGLAVTVSLPAA